MLSYEPCPPTTRAEIQGPDPTTHPPSSILFCPKFPGVFSQKNLDKNLFLGPAAPIFQFSGACGAYFSIFRGLRRLFSKFSGPAAPDFLVGAWAGYPLITKRGGGGLNPDPTHHWVGQFRPAGPHYPPPYYLLSSIQGCGSLLIEINTPPYNARPGNFLQNLAK